MYERKSRGATAYLREGRIHVPIAAQILTTETPPELGQAFAAVAERVWEKVSGAGVVRASGPRIVVE